MTHFKPLRRKIGVLMLIVAGVFAAFWIRSHTVVDWFMFTVRPGRLVFVISYPNGFKVVRNEFEREVRAGTIWLANPVTKNDFDERVVLGPRDMLQIDRRWKWMGFCFSSNKDKEELTLNQHNVPLNHETFWFVPHWSIVIPLTLLSACLLLSEPRAKTSPGPTHV